MGLSKKREQQLAQIVVRAAKSKKSRKVDQENQRKKRFLSCKYTLDRLKEDMPYDLSQVIKHSTILRYFKKIDLYI